MTWQVIYQTTFYHISKPEDPDAFAININYMQMDQNGNLHNKFFATQLSHFQYNNSANFQKPIITIVTPNKTDWVITAKRGNSKHGSEKIDLVGNVKFYQAAGLDNQETTISTEHAVFFMEQKLIKTDKHVVITQPGLIAESDGADANLATSFISLLSNVNETYAPQANRQFAKNLDSKQPVHVTAQRANYDRSSHVTTYLGNVFMKQGSTVLNADKVIIYDRLDDNKVTKVIALGKPAVYSTIPRGKTDRLNASARRIEYYPENKTAILIGNGKITQKNNSFVANRIVYDLNTDTVKTNPTENTKSKIVIVP